jgi:3-hydroxyacyl-[acyl-carrier-protein] dehydratase
MRFSLIDRIDVLEPGVRCEAIKVLTMAEEYLADHFPHFPVMPGVLMLEAMTQTSAWLVRASEDFARSMVVLKEARSVKYGQFVEPGQTLRLSAEIISQSDRETVVKARGMMEGRVTVGARLILERYNLADEDPSQIDADRIVRHQMRALFQLLWQPAPPTGDNGRMRGSSVALPADSTKT